jgi:DNA-binding NarL/FixJ family response regulator
VIMLTTFELDEYVFEALQAGAAGFLIKDSEPVEMLRAIRVVAAGESLLSPSVTKRVVESFTARSVVRKAHPQLGELTDREREVLALLADGLTNAAIAERMFVSVHTVRNHIANLSAKLGAHSKLEALSIAVRLGLLPDR